MGFFILTISVLIFCPQYFSEILMTMAGISLLGILGERIIHRSLGMKVQTFRNHLGW